MTFPGRKNSLDIRPEADIQAIICTSMAHFFVCRRVGENDKPLADAVGCLGSDGPHLLGKKKIEIILRNIHISLCSKASSQK